MDNLLHLRGELNKIAKVKISVNDMIMKAASLACVKVPETNSGWIEEKDGRILIRRYKEINMCVAVQTNFGLMAPVIRNTNNKGLEQIA